MQKLLLFALTILLLAGCKPQTESEQVKNTCATLLPPQPIGQFASMEKEYAQWKNSGVLSYVPEEKDTNITHDEIIRLHREIDNLVYYVEAVFQTARSGFNNRYEFLDKKLAVSERTLTTRFPVTFILPVALQYIADYPGSSLTRTRANGGAAILAYIMSRDTSQPVKIRYVSNYSRAIQLRGMQISHDLKNLKNEISANPRLATRFAGSVVPQGLPDFASATLLGHIIEGASVVELLADLGMIAGLQHRFCLKVDRKTSDGYKATEHYQNTIDCYSKRDSLIWPSDASPAIDQAFRVISQKNSDFISWPTITLSGQGVENALMRFEFFDDDTPFLRNWFFRMAFLRTLH